MPFQTGDFKSPWYTSSAIDPSWCERGDLNPHELGSPDPKSGTSANFTTPALIKYLSWWPKRNLNPQSTAYEAVALPSYAIQPNYSLRW